MRLTMLQLKRRLETAPLCSMLRFLPFILLIIGIKVYAVSLLLSSGLVVKQQRGSVEASYADIPHKLQDVARTTTEEPGWREKQVVLSQLHNGTVSVTPSATNRTLETVWLFYNRIPRSGGKTLVALLQALGTDLDYQHQEHAYRTPWQRLMSEEEQENLATWYEYNLWPKTYDRLALFINFTEFRRPYVHQRPATITLLRDPADQFMSQYHHRRTDSALVKKHMAVREHIRIGAGREWYWRDPNDCILEEDEECTLPQGQPDFDRAVPFLCGQHVRCLNLGEKWALQRAKYMAEYEYSVVGILENFNETLGVLEHYLPAFFQGARQRYWSDEFKNNRKKNKQPRRVKPLSERALKVLKTKLASEYELYEFCKQRLAHQHRQVAPLLSNTSPLPPVKGPVQKLGPWERFQIEMNL